jgi:putative endopeptidase
MDELSAFISDSGNQLVVSPLMEVTDVDDLKDSTKKILYLMPWPLSLTDAAEYSTMTDAGKRTKAAAETMFTAFMAKFGMSREEAEKAYGELFAFETQLAGSVVPNADEQSYMMETDSYHIMSMDELSAECRNYPVAAVLKQYKDAGIKSFNNYQSKWLAKLDELYTSGNLENWKNVLLYNLMMENVNCLDEDCLKMFTEYNNTINGTGNAPDVEGSAYTNCNERLKWAVGKMYCDQYITADMKNNIKNMISEIIAVYRKRLEKADWLSEATRKKAVEKLDAIKIHAVYPDDWTPYEYAGLDFPSAEGDTGLFADMQAIGRYERNAMIKRVINPPKGDIWYAVPQEADAMYIPTQNSINITAGVLGDAFYDPKASESTNLGGIGEVIGHEITHAFDSSGSTFVKDGNMNDWWTDEDRAAFNRKTAKVSEYYAAFEPLSGYKVSGSMTLRETVADLGSYSCLMELAKTKPDFNYKEFFTNTAKMFRMQQSEIAEQVWLQQNPHPPYYLRVNVNLSMLQEFQDTYGVKAGDNMYVAAADRLSVW